MEKNYKKYIFVANTTMPISSLKKIIKKLGIWHVFREILAFEHWTKKENILSVMKKYKLQPQDILFIDDNIQHIEKVQDTWIYTLHYTNYTIDIENKITNFF